MSSRTGAQADRAVIRRARAEEAFRVPSQRKSLQTYEMREGLRTRDENLLRRAWRSLGLGERKWGRRSDWASHRERDPRPMLISLYKRQPERIGQFFSIS